MPGMCKLAGRDWSLFFSSQRSVPELLQGLCPPLTAAAEGELPLPNRATFVGGFTHEFDLVGNVIGMNTLNPIRIIGSILRSPTLMMGPSWSPHSLYLYSEIK
jgi:hypothetical protein